MRAPIARVGRVFTAIHHRERLLTLTRGRKLVKSGPTQSAGIGKNYAHHFTPAAPGRPHNVQQNGSEPRRRHSEKDGQRRPGHAFGWTAGPEAIASAHGEPGSDAAQLRDALRSTALGQANLKGRLWRRMRTYSN